jgi:hypothetical protein
MSTVLKKFKVNDTIPDGSVFLFKKKTKKGLELFFSVPEKAVVIKKDNIDKIST